MGIWADSSPIYLGIAKEVPLLAGKLSLFPTHRRFISNPTTMPKYTPVSSDSLAELDDWQEDPEASVETRNRPINLHRRPGFYSKSLLVSVGLNAILLMVMAFQYMRLRKCGLL